jgi:diacylglycerol kinase (ATP)
MRVKVLLNPSANQRRARQRLSEVKSALINSDLDYDLLILQRKGQARREAQVAALNGYDAVVAAGGDGTVHEIVNGLSVAAGDGPTMPLGILPLGTGNDFSDMVGLPRDLKSACEVITAGNTRQIDAGWVSYTSGNGNGHGPMVWRGCFFDNSCAVAMEPIVTMEVNRLKRLSGNIRYVVAVFRALLKMQSWHMQISWDGGSYEGDTYLVSVANTPRTGGQFLVAPNAKVDDGAFDYVIAPKVPVREIFKILPGFLNGTHVQHPAILTGRTSQLHVVSRPRTPIHADGEILTALAAQVHYRIKPGKITLLVPTDPNPGS